MISHINFIKYPILFGIHMSINLILRNEFKYAIICALSAIIELKFDYYYYNLLLYLDNSNINKSVNKIVSTKNNNLILAYLNHNAILNTESIVYILKYYNEIPKSFIEHIVKNNPFILHKLVKKFNYEIDELLEENDIDNIDIDEFDNINDSYYKFFKSILEHSNKKIVLDKNYKIAFDYIHSDYAHYDHEFDIFDLLKPSEQDIQENQQQIKEIFSNDITSISKIESYLIDTTTYQHLIKNNSNNIKFINQTQLNYDICKTVQKNLCKSIHIQI